MPTKARAPSGTITFLPALHPDPARRARLYEVVFRWLDLLDRDPAAFAALGDAPLQAAPPTSTATNVPSTARGGAGAPSVPSAQSRSPHPRRGRRHVRTVASNPQSPARPYGTRADR